MRRLLSGLALLAASLVATTAVACGSSDDPAPTPVPAADIAATVTAAMSAGQTSGDDIQKMVQDAVMAAPQGVTAEQLQAQLEASTAGQLSAAEVRSIVAQSLDALPPPQIDVAEIQGLVENAVRENVPEGTSEEEINEWVTSAVAAATADAPTRGSVSDAVAQAVQDAAADQLTAEQVQSLIDAATAATNEAIEAATANQLTAEDVMTIVQGPPTCMSKGYEITDCPPRSPHVWKPARQQVPGEVWVFQDAYKGAKPTQFFESPYSAQLVKQGLIPPLMDRLPVPEDVEVIAGPDGIGEYGGYYRQIQTHNYIGEWITASWNRRDSLGGLRWFPWVGKGWDVSEDGRVWTFTNRRDLKWSDGKPLDMESIRFAWELNFDPTFGRTFPLEFSSPVTQNPPVFNVVDDTTWTLTYDDPIFTIMESRATPSSLCGPGRVCITAHPKMKKYYPQYAGQEAIDKLIKDEGHTDLTALLNDRWHVYTNIEEIPCAAPFCATSDSDSLTEWEKNQYHWFVDPEGNQIPYMDGAVMEKLASRDTIIFRAMNGDEDGRTSTFIPGELPLYVQNMERGDFSIFHWPSSGGADLSTTMQQTYNVDPRIGELIRTQDFRLALSATVDKNDLNSVVLSSIGVVQNRVPRPNNPYYPGDDFRLLHMEQDLDKANMLLDGLDLTQTDADGFRMHKDGSGTVELTLTIDDNPAVVSSAEILKRAWQSVGIKTNIDVRGQAYKVTRGSMGTSTIARDYSAYQYNPWMVQWTSLAPLSVGELAGEIGRWYSSKGDEGMAPTGGDPDWLPLAGEGEFPADAGGLLARQSQLWIDGLGVSNLDPRRVQMGKEMFSTNAEQLWALNCCAYSGVFRGIYISRNNFRNKPITHERDHNGFTAWARFFEDGSDNYHHPNNRSQYCQSWAFIQGGSPYDRCTKAAW